MPSFFHRASFQNKEFQPRPNFKKKNSSSQRVSHQKIFLCFRVFNQKCLPGAREFSERKLVKKKKNF